MLSSVKSYFLFIVITTLVSILVLIFSLVFSLSKLSVLTDLDKSVEQMRSQALELRKDEKNFFIRREKMYLDKFDEDYEYFMQTTKEIKNVITSLGHGTEKADQISSVAKHYRLAFKNISKAYIQRGLTHQDGLRENLTQSAKQLETALDNEKEKTLLLQIIRAEKNFFSRKEQVYADEEEKYFDLLHTRLKKKEHKGLLENYQYNFLQMYNLHMKIGLDNSQGYTKEMSDASENMHKTITEYTQAIITLIEEERNVVTNITFTIFILTGSVLFILILTSSRKLANSFDTLIQFFKDAKVSHTHIDNTQLDFSEFIQLHKFANEMIDARNKAEKELAELNRTLEQRVEDGLQEIKALNKEIVDTQKEVVFTMGAIGESRSKETGNHVKRVAQYSYILAKAYGLSEHECNILKEASPMHDIAKVAIPDSLLNKPGAFNEEEQAVMQTHAELGHEMLKHSSRELLKSAAIISYEHHEKFDGTGYPRGIKGEDIHIYGRITALADVFDALGSDRCYKKAWPDEKIFSMFKEESGKHFDPKLVECFFDNLHEILQVREEFKDVFDE